MTSSRCRSRDATGRRAPDDRALSVRATSQTPASVLTRWAALAGVATTVGLPRMARASRSGPAERLLSGRRGAAHLDDGGGNAVHWTTLDRGRETSLLWGWDREDDPAAEGGLWTDPGLSSLAEIATGAAETRECSFAYLHDGADWFVVGATPAELPVVARDLFDDARLLTTLTDLVVDAHDATDPAPAGPADLDGLADA